MNDQRVNIGAELFRQAFMAVDYLEMRLIPRRSRVRNDQSDGVSRKRAKSSQLRAYVMSERGDVPGWVLVVLMTTGLVTAIWAVAAPRLNTILKNSLDSMSKIR